MRFSIVSAIIASAGLVAAAPASDPSKREMNFGGLGPLAGLIGNSGSGVGNGLANGGQDILAELFKGGDALLNIPGDAINNLLSGKPISAATNAAGNLMKVASQLPGDVAKMGAHVASGVGEDVKKVTN
ncbi:hypothetical protein NOR_03115 [Metarhizium rileyi]|uniref:Uncharacterized protein n=1 Tax=Metarhizium rileyi (strain RCEF 4871) TaxID=1649241 RepID=A0A167GAC8_METRR|nr:hypothetical protein NOR_03115 [Metarhizium rileyi RCEF 4871]